MTERWHPDGHMVLDDQTGASISCMGPVASATAEAHGAALAQRVAIVLNDSERRPGRMAAGLARTRRSIASALWLAVPTVVAAGVLLPEWRARLAWIGLGATLGVLGPVVWVWSNRRDAEASHVRKDVALEALVTFAVTDKERITGEQVALPPERPYDWATQCPDEIEVVATDKPTYPARCGCGEFAAVFDEDGEVWCQACWDEIDAIGAVSD